MLIISCSLSLEQLGEKFGGMKVHAMATPRATATSSSPGVIETLVVLVTPSTPILQPVAPTATAVVGVLMQATVAADFATPPPLLLPAALGAPVVVRALAPAVAAGIPAPVPVATAGIPPQDMISAGRITTIPLGGLVRWAPKPPSPFLGSSLPPYGALYSDVSR